MDRRLQQWLMFCLCCACVISLTVSLHIGTLRNKPIRTISSLRSNSNQLPQLCNKLLSPFPSRMKLFSANPALEGEDGKSRNIEPSKLTEKIPVRKTIKKLFPLGKFILFMYFFLYFFLVNVDGGGCIDG